MKIESVSFNIDGDNWGNVWGCSLYLHLKRGKSPSQELSISVDDHAPEGKNVSIESTIKMDKEKFLDIMGKLWDMAVIKNDR